jgi:hypothetical protein
MNCLICGDRLVRTEDAKQLHNNRFHPAQLVKRTKKQIVMEWEYRNHKHLIY